jgi:hypothetical protein
MRQPALSDPVPNPSLAAGDSLLDPETEPRRFLQDGVDTDCPQFRNEGRLLLCPPMFAADPTEEQSQN